LARRRARRSVASVITLAATGTLPGIGAGVRGYAPVGTGPGLVFLSGSSNAQGFGTAALMTDFPGIATPYAGFQFSRVSALAGANPTFISEAKQDLQPRTATLGGSYPAGTCGAELQMGRLLDAVNAGQWGGATFTVDGSRLDDAYEWLNPSWPTTPPQGMTRLDNAMGDAITAHGKELRVVGWDQGNDGNVAEGADYYANMVDWANRVRLKRGDVGILLPILTNNNTSGGLMQKVLGDMEAFAMRPDSGRVRTVYLNHLGLIDGAHYTNDAGGVKGYCEAGNLYAPAVISAANQTFDHSFPIWGCQAKIVSATSAALPAVPLPMYWGGMNNKQDIALIIYAGASNNTVPAPTNWTQVANSPVWDNSSASNARLHVYMRTLTGTALTANSETAPSIADVASDDAKVAGIIVIRNSTGLDATPTFSTVSAAAASTAVSWPDITTVTANSLIVHIMGCRIDSDGPKCSGYTNGALTELSERVDFHSVIGLGYGIVVAIGKKASVGAIGNTTATLATASSQARMTLAFKP
jgi:hypothetical protein